MEHIPVLLSESIAALHIKQDGIYFDCTLGRAGHTSAILQHLGPQGVLYAFDQDAAAINAVRNKINDDRLILIHDNFKNLEANLALLGVKGVDGIFYDLGVSSPHLDEGARGFSYRFDAELDMRMDQTNNELTAKTVVNTFSEQRLANIFAHYGEEKLATRIAKKIVAVRAITPINTTFQLVDAIKQALPQKVLKQKKHPAKKVFQALRIFINNELEVIEISLQQAVKLLNPAGVLAVITFHSLEEKIVKTLMKDLSHVPNDPVLSKLPINVVKTPEFTMKPKKPIVPSEQELHDNNRSHSAKLWVLQKNGA